MKDYLIRGIDESQNIKVFLARTTNIVEEARKRHNLSKSASAALGRTLSAGILMSSNLKNTEDSLTLNILGDGDLGRIVVTCKNDGNIKGYVDNPFADAPAREDGKIDVGRVVGYNGTFTVVMDLGLKEPYVGQVPLVSGEIGEDLANYFYQSDQVDSAVGLGVLVDTDLSIKAAGGYIIQLLPGVSDEDLEKIENAIRGAESLTTMLDKGLELEEIMEKVLPGFNIKILERKEIFFKCECSREKVEDSLESLGPKEITDIIKEDGEAELTCHFCGNKYFFNRVNLEHILEKSKKHNEDK